MFEMFKSIYNSIIINGKSYKGNNVSIINGNVKIDGVHQTHISSEQIINVTVHGEVDLINSDCGDVTCQDVGSIKLDCGNIRCNDVKGDINIDTGNVDCDKVSGNVSVDCGSITHI